MIRHFNLNGLLLILTICFQMFPRLLAKANVTIAVTLSIENEKCAKGVNVIEMTVTDENEKHVFAEENVYVQRSCNDVIPPEVYFDLDYVTRPLKIKSVLNLVKEKKKITLHTVRMDLTTPRSDHTADVTLKYHVTYLRSYKCSENYYETFCEKECIEEISHTCDEYGNKRCNKDYINQPTNDICIHDLCTITQYKCYNGGKCVNPGLTGSDPMHVTCSCPEGFAGKQCEAEASEAPTTIETTPSSSTRMNSNITTTLAKNQELTTKIPIIDSGSEIWIKDSIQSAKNENPDVKTSVTVSDRKEWNHNSYTIIIAIFVVSAMCFVLVLILGVVSYTSCRKNHSRIKINPDLTGPPNMNNIFTQPGSIQPVYLDGTGQFAAYDDLPYYQKSPNFIDPRSYGGHIDSYGNHYPSDTIRSQSSAVFIAKPDNYFQADNESLVLHVQNGQSQKNGPFPSSINDSIHDDIALSNLYSKYNTTNLKAKFQETDGKYSFMQHHTPDSRPLPTPKAYHESGGYQSNTLNKRYSQVNFMNYNYPITLPKQFSESFYDTWKTPYSDFHMRDIPTVLNGGEVQIKVSEIEVPDETTTTRNSDDEALEKRKSPKPPVEFS